jgi:putative SOS response-associated peptidase YedK
MCGRYTLTSEQGIVEELELATAEPPEPSEWWRPRFNIAPTQPAPVVLAKDGERRLEMMRWGLVPHWADSLAIGARMINARIETLDAKPAFRDALAHRRCLVPADGFFEWRLRGAGRSAKRFPIYLHPEPRRVIAFAGLWDRWKNPDGIWILSFTIITGPPNELAAKYHDRMAVVLDRAQREVWLAEGKLPEEPAPIGDWRATEVSPHANSPMNDDPQCIEPVEPPPDEDRPPEPPPKPKPKQLKLF